MQVCHSNVIINIHICLAIRQNNLLINLPAEKYRVSENTVFKLLKDDVNLNRKYF